MNEELIQYLSDEYMACVHKEESVIQRKYDLEMEKRKYEESLSFSIEDEKRRQLFSPLYLNNTYQDDVSFEEFDSSEKGKNLQKYEEELKEIEKKKNKLKEFIHSLSQISMKFDQFDDQEKIYFFPAFDEIVDLTKKVLKEIEIDYDQDYGKTNCLMTLSFVFGWKRLFDYFQDSLLLSYILIHTMIDRNRIIIVIECISKVPLGKQAKNGLENVLSNDFYLQSWSDSTFEVNIMIK